MALTKSQKGWQTYVKLACEADAKAKLAKMDEEIKKLEQDRHDLDEAIQLKKLNLEIGRVMNKWVKVPNYHWIDEKNEVIEGYRYFKVIGVNKWEGNNSFSMCVRNGVYIGKHDVDFIPNSDEYHTEDLRNWKIVSEEVVEKAIRNARDKMNKKFNSILVKCV